MHKMKIVFSKYFIYPLFFLTFLVLYCFISQLFIAQNQKLRNLAENNLEEICKENGDLYNHYYKSEEFQVTDKKFGEMNSASQIILDIITDGFSAKYIFKYFWHTGVYVFFVFLLIFIILASIYYSFASCIRCCTDKCCDFFSFECCKNRCFKKTICILVPFVYLIVFILAIFSLFFAVLAINRFSGAICVGGQLVDSLVKGETKDRLPKWAGISIISEILEKLGKLTKMDEALVKDINDNRLNFVSSTQKWYEYLNQSVINHQSDNMSLTSPKMSLNDEEKPINVAPIHSYKWKDIIGQIHTNDEENAMRIYNTLDIIEGSLFPLLGCNADELTVKCNQSTVSKFFFEARDTIKGFEEPVTEIENKVIDPVQNVYDTVNSTVVTIFSVIIFFVILYCIIVELLLSVFCCAKKCKCLSCCIKWFLCFIYYTSIFIVIIGFIFGIVVGVIGDIVKNMTNVVQFITSSENLLDDQPIVVKKSSYLEYLDVCLNGDGDMAAKFGLTESLEDIENITNIADDTEEIIDNTTNPTCPDIDEYIEYLNGLDKSYLNSEYYDVDDGSKFNIEDRIKEINNYVSGKYANESGETCMINETWSTDNKSDEYTYDSTYPTAEVGKKYLLYLYDKILYEKVDFKTRYNDACPTEGHPYTTVSGASEKFGDFLKKIREETLSDKFSKSYKDDLDQLNKLFKEKNKYLHKASELSIKPITDIVQTVSNYQSGVFNLLNCKFVGTNKLILMNVLYDSLGKFLEYFGLCFTLLSLFIFIGIVFILITIKNTKLDEKKISSDIDLETLSDILQGNDVSNDLMNTEKNQELMNY